MTLHLQLGCLCDYCSVTSPVERVPSRPGPSKSSLNPLVPHCACRSSFVLVKRGGTYCIRHERRTVRRGKPAASASETGATLRRTRGRAHQVEMKSRKLEAAWALLPFSVFQVLPPAAVWPWLSCSETRF